MTIITCPNCRQNCSSQSPFCGHCGRPLYQPLYQPYQSYPRQKSAFTKDLGAGGVVYSLLLILGIFILAFSSPGMLRMIGGLLILMSLLLLLVRIFGK